MRISFHLITLHFFNYALADYHQCSTNPKQQPYRWLTSEEFLDLAGSILDDMFQGPTTKREVDGLTRPLSAKYERQVNGDSTGTSQGSQEGGIELTPTQHRLLAGDPSWASLTPERWNDLEQGLRTAQEQTVNQFINAVAQHNQAANRRALEAADKIAEAAAETVKTIGDSVYRQVNTLGNTVNNNVVAIGLRFEELLRQRLVEGSNRWATEITATAVRRFERFADLLDERIVSVVEATADSVTQGSTAMDVRTPPEPFGGRFKVLNQSCRWLYWCGSKIAKVFRCVFLCNMNAGDRATRTRTACANFLQVISLGTILVGGLVLVLNRLQVPIPGEHSPEMSPPQSGNSTVGNITITEAPQHVDQIPAALNVKVEARGPLPPDLPVGDEPMVTQLGDETLPDYAAKWLTHPNRKIDCADPPNSTSNSEKHQRNRRDDPNDNRCVPTHGEDLQSLVWNLMWTQYLPQLDQGIMSASYSLYDEALEGSEDIYKGGAVKVHFWVTEKPDIDGMKAPVENDDPSWSYRPPSKVYGQECFDTYFPAMADNITDGTPTKNWVFAFADACKNVMGKRLATPTDFIYAGKGYNTDPQNGVGFNGTYHAEGCQSQIKCTDLVGLNGDGVSGGDIQKHFDHCKSVTSDGRYHGGMFYHSSADKGGRYGRHKKRDDPWVPNRCGYIQIEPLGDDGIDVQTGKNGPQQYWSDAPSWSDELR